MLPGKPILCLTAAMIALLVSASLAFPKPVTVSVECCVMSAISEMLDQFKNRVETYEANRFTNHERDDLGYPLCACANCQSVLKRMHDAHTAAVLSGNHDPDRFGFGRIIHANENDYDGDLGREHDDHMRDNGYGAGSSSLGSFVQIADALPVIEAPSIVAELPDEAEQTVEYLAKGESEG